MTRRALVAAGLVASALGVVFLDTPLCPTAFFLGVPCPGCGLTRATLALARGDLHAALGFHPLAPLLSPLFAVALGKTLVDYVRGPNSAALAPARAPWWTGLAATWLAAALLALVLGVWILRFAGYFGGPVAVESFRDRWAR
jgi:hypothetical protein